MSKNNNDRDEDDIFDENEDTVANRYLTFRLNDEDYGVEIQYVTEIVCIPKITQVPDLPNFVKGVVNLRGQVIPVLDLRIKFHMEPREYDAKTCVIVIHLDKMFIGLIVDTVQDVREILPENVSPAPHLSNAPASRYILGMGKVGEAVNILLDVKKLLGENEVEAFRQVEP